MPALYNGMYATDLPQGIEWHKSSQSSSQGNCVEVAKLPGGRVGVRNSRYPDGNILIFTRTEFDALVLGAKDGEFDDLY